MKPLRFLRRPRLRTVLLLGLACWVVFSAVWLTRRWIAVRILENSSFVESHWTFPSWPKSLGLRWSQMLPTARVDGLHIDGGFEDLADGAKIAWAIRVCGQLEELRVSVAPRSGRAAPQMRTFLQNLGPQPRVRSLDLFAVPLSEDDCLQVLEQFPGVEDLRLGEIPCTGRSFPKLDALKTMNMFSLPFSDEGLANTLRCPSLREVHLVKTAVTLAGLRQLPRLRPQSALRLTFTNATVDREELEALGTLLEKAWPGSRAAVSEVGYDDGDCNSLEFVP